MRILSPMLAKAPGDDADGMGSTYAVIGEDPAGIGITLLPLKAKVGGSYFLGLLLKNPGNLGREKPPPPPCFWG